MLVKNILNTSLFDKTSSYNIYNKKVHLTASCTFFPEFDLTGTIIGFIREPNPIIKVKLFNKNNKIFKVDALMNGLDLEMIK